MAPTVGTRGYPQQSLSNPFGHLAQQQQHHQQSHLQHPSSLQSHGFGGNAHHAFSGGQNGGLGLFAAPQQQQGNNTFGSHHQQLPGFGHGGSQHPLHAQAHAQAHHGHQHDGTASERDRIREVWANNLETEFAIIRQLIQKYPYVSMDTEFPGVVARPIADSFAHKASYHYQTIRCNVDLLKMIQLGITLFNADGEVPPPNALDGLVVRGVPISAIQRVCPATWTFNFKFSLDEDMYASDSIELLKRAGHDFQKHAQFGIEFQEFGSLLITSGLTFSEDVHWISFHSGYDFGYLMKVMWCKMLPTDEDSYRRLMQKFFPNIYDVKFILRYSQKMRDKGTVTSQAANVLQSIGIKSSLQDLADELGCVRHGMQHDAGSDAWLTGQLYFEIRKRLFDGQTPEELKGNMWGLDGVGPPASAAAQAAALAQAMQNQAAAGNGILGSALYHGIAGHHRDGPSTPTTNPAGLASTPGQGFQSSMTPGAGGVFGNYQYAK